MRYIKILITSKLQGKQVFDKVINVITRLEPQAYIEKFYPAIMDKKSLLDAYVLIDEKLADLPQIQKTVQKLTVKPKE